MNTFRDLIIQRRSTRIFNSALLTPEETQSIIESALLSPTSRNSKSWEFIIVEDKETLQKLSLFKPHGAQLIAGASLAVVVLGNPLISDVWIEDASIAAVTMQLQAEDLGIGSCWVEARERSYTDTISSQDYLTDLFDIPMPLQALCVIAFGKRDEKHPPHDTDDLSWDKVHISKYTSR